MIQPSRPKNTSNSSRSPKSRVVPFWDDGLRELRLGRVVVKRFRRPARNQIMVLSAFQEDGWPDRIDSPLSGETEFDARNRLHETVKKLNRQMNHLLSFFSDGTGQGIIWRKVRDSTAIRST
jgi:hypothetical protein